MAQEKKEKTNEVAHWLNQVTNTLDQNIKGVQYGLYGIGFVGLCVALRSVRPFQRFRKPRDIPSSFIKRRITLNGVVKGAELGQGAAVLQVSHQPPVALTRGDSPPFLPVALSGISPTMNGLSWMQIVLANENIQFTVLSTNQNAAYSIVTLKGKDIGARLVELGFATVAPHDFSLDHNELYKKQYSKLLKYEKRAERHGVGIWWGHDRLLVKLADKLTARVKLWATQVLPKRMYWSSQVNLR